MPIALFAATHRLRLSGGALASRCFSIKLYQSLRRVAVVAPLINYINYTSLEVAFMSKVRAVP